MKNKKSFLKNLILLTTILLIVSSGKIYANNNLKFTEDPYSKESKKYFDNSNLETEDSKNNYLYNSIYNALVNLEDSVNLSKYGVPDSLEVFNIRKKVLDDHPEIFYFKYEDSVYWSNGKLEFKYIDSKDKIKDMINQLNKKVENIFGKNISKSMTDIEKVMAIHDYLILNTKYSSEDNSAFDVYGILIKGKGVCQGYAMSMKLLLNKVDIDSIYVTSEKMNHMWNIVDIDGYKYQLDCTWDDPLPDREGVIRYSYLALSDSEMGKDHVWDKSKYPECNSDKYRYMREMDYVVKSRNFIYYSNTSNNGYIYKINKDGSNKVKLLNIYGNPMYIKNGYLYYKNVYTGNIDKVFVNDSSVDESSDGFKDLKNHWAINEIEKFYKDGYIDGYEDNTFRPDNSITRAEFVKIFNSYFGLTKSSGKVFNDTKNHWARTQIDIAFTNGVANGVSNELFNPDEPITREEAAKMIANYKKISDSNFDKLNKFKDYNQVSLWATKEVEGILENKYMQGYEDNTFRPKNDITRAEAVATLSRIK